MQVGTAQARRTDTHNDLIGSRDGGFGHLLQREIHVHVLVIGVQSRSFHGACSSPAMAPSWWARRAGAPDRRQTACSRKGCAGVTWLGLVAPSPDARPLRPG